MRNAREYRTFGTTLPSRRILSDGDCTESARADEVGVDEDWADGRSERFEGEILQKFDL